MNESAVHNLFIDRLQYLYWAEKDWMESLSIIKGAASSDHLKNVFQCNTDQMQMHVSSIEKIFGLLDEKVTDRRGHPMEFILNEINLVISETGSKSSVRDAALIILAKKAIHYELLAYEILLEFSKIMGNINVSQLLDIILEDEMQISHKLSELAQRSIDEIINQSR